MTLPTTLPAIPEALRNAAATEEMLAAAITADRGARAPHRARDAERKTARPSSQKRGSSWPASSGRSGASNGYSAGSVGHRAALAAQHDAEPLADVGPMRRLMDQGCDLEAAWK